MSFETNPNFTLQKLRKTPFVNPEKAIIFTKQETDTKTTTNKTLTRELFPHQLTTTALKEVGAQIIATDISYETKTTNTTNPRTNPTNTNPNLHSGTRTHNIK
jgi:hypothetical protein